MDGAAASNATSASVTSATSVMAASVSPDPPGLSLLHTVTSAPVSALEVDPYTVQPDMSAWVGH